MEPQCQHQAQHTAGDESRLSLSLAELHCLAVTGKHGEHPMNSSRLLVLKGVVSQKVAKTASPNVPKNVSVDRRPKVTTTLVGNEVWGILSIFLISSIAR